MPEPTVPDLLWQANAHHQAGRLREAEQLYRQVLAREPGNADAMHYLGLLGHQIGQTAAGLELLRRSVQLASNSPGYRLNLARVLQETGDHSGAATEFAAALQSRSDDAAALVQFAVSLQAMGRWGEAESALRRSIALRPNFPEAHNNLGALLRSTGREEEAAAAFAAALAQNPNEASAHANLAGALFALGRLPEAEQSCRRAIELAPRLANAWLTLALIEYQQRRLDDSSSAAQRAIEIDPNNAEAHLCLASALDDQGQVLRGLEHLRAAVKIRPNDPRALSKYLYTRHFDPSADPQAIRREHEDWDARFARPLMRAKIVDTASPVPTRRLRIGYVGPTLRGHVVGLYLEPVLESHDRQAFEIVCYSDTTKPDAVTERLKKHADRWRDSAKLSDAELSEQIRRDGIDILIDLNLHMAGSRLLTFARRPAPVQIAYLGYPATTGLAVMDFAVTDVHLDPPGQTEQNYTENLLRLPHTYWCYREPEGSPPVNALPAKATGCITFGSLNNFIKLNDAVIALWSRILASVPNSRLAVMLEGGARSNASVLQRLQSLGIRADRLLVFEPLPRAAYLALYHQIDIALDPFPYAGHTTSFDAAWMGVPLVTLAGRSSVARAGVTVLTNLSMADFIAQTPDEYVRIAIELARDMEKLAEIRRGLRERMRQSPVMDAIGYTRSLESLLWDRHSCLPNW